MITKTSTGVCIEGRLAFEPQIKQAGSKDVYKLPVRAFASKSDAGQYDNIDVECCIWRGIEQWDGMLQKGDHVLVYAREVKKREYNGKVYYSADAEAIYPDGSVIFRWLQDAINVMCEQPALPEPTATNEPTPFDEKPPAPPQLVQTALGDAQLYAGEMLTDYGPERKGSTQADDDAIIATDAYDLPF